MGRRRAVLTLVTFVKNVRSRVHRFDTIDSSDNRRVPCVQKRHHGVSCTYQQLFNFTRSVLFPRSPISGNGRTPHQNPDNDFIVRVKRLEIVPRNEQSHNLFLIEWHIAMTTSYHLKKCMSAIKCIPLPCSVFAEATD